VSFKFRKNLRLAVAYSLLALASLVGTNAQQANAATVTISLLYPDTSTTYYGPIGPFPIDYFSAPDPFAVSRPWTFSVVGTASGYQITFNPNETNTYGGSVAFNGFEFLFSGAPTITGISNDGSSTFNPNPIGTTFNSTAVFLDYQAGTPVNGQSSIVNVAAAVPEPSTWAMLILGFAGVGFMAYRRKNKAMAFRFA
jgi:PEP-CTERM motif